MVESKYVLNGLIAGTLGGIAQVVHYAVSILPRVDINSVTVEIEKYSGVFNANITGIGELVKFALYVAPIVTIVFLAFIGAVLGALQEHITRKTTPLIGYIVPVVLITM